MVPESGFASVNGARLYYDLVGALDAPVVVLLHAGIADHRMWDPQLVAFAARFRVLRLDFRGFGESDLPPGPFSWRADLYGLLSLLGIARASLVGCSIGAGVALDAAVERPDLVEDLVLVGPGSGGTLPQSDFLRRYNEEEEVAHRAGDTERYAETNVRVWVDGPNRAPDQVAHSVREYVRSTTRGDLTRDWRNAPQQRLSPPAFTRLEEMHARTLLVAGDQDVPDISAAVDVLSARLPNARRHVIPNTAHLPNMEEATLFNQVVLEFLERETGSR